MHAAIHAFLRRVRTAVFWSAFAYATGAFALVLVVGLLTARVFGVWPAPAWWWCAGLALPIAWGGLSVRRAGFGVDRSALHLDRRLGLEGLLLTSRERDARAWDAQLAAGLARAADGMPKLQTRRLLRGAVPPLALLVGVVLLPPPAQTTDTRVDPVLEQALVDLGEQLELLREEGVVDEAKGEQMAGRIQELERKLEDGDAVEWSDVDSVEALMAQEKSAELAALEKALSAAAELGEENASNGSSSKAEQLADALAKARAAGLLPELPKELLDRLAAATGGVDFDPAALPTDPAALAALGEALRAALARAGEAAAADLAAADLLDPGELADLAAVCAACRGAGAGAGDGDGDGRPGKGGINRGPGPAKLLSNHQTQGDADAFRSEKLPPGRVRDEKWSVVGIDRAAADADPTRDRGTGSAGASGTGRAAWRRRLAPRHREAVRKFFESGREE